jgi:hypothetical protein
VRKSTAARGGNNLQKIMLAFARKQYNFRRYLTDRARTYTRRFLHDLHANGAFSVGAGTIPLGVICFDLRDRAVSNYMGLLCLFVCRRVPLRLRGGLTVKRRFAFLRGQTRPIASVWDDIGFAAPEGGTALGLYFRRMAESVGYSSRSPASAREPRLTRRAR